MRILLTNDDGIQSEGLRTVYEVLRDEYEVWVVAPDRNRSGASSSITMDSKLIVQRNDERCFACSGTPADCVLVAEYILNFKPDLVLSGINHGANIGHDISYSGTIAAARQAVYMGIPGVAMSIPGNGGNILSFYPLAHFIKRNVKSLQSMSSDNRHLVNINAPNSLNEAPDYQLAQPTNTRFRTRFDVSRIDDSKFACSHADVSLNREHEEGSDAAILASGKIAVSVVDITYGCAREIHQQYIERLE